MFKNLKVPFNIRSSSEDQSSVVQNPAYEARSIPRKSMVYYEIKDLPQNFTKPPYGPLSEKKLISSEIRSKECNVYDHLHDTNTPEGGNSYSHTTPVPFVISTCQENRTGSSGIILNDFDKREDDPTCSDPSEEISKGKEDSVVYFVLEKEVQ
ncbi:uncharacterized protein LOC134231051 [Saccostrea cucullata]|uniref:uncharacterized protein LOC134231051 n=1 Tax=Saccostrea cuccullata TaxID=36930 RepID=UPI002ED63E35